ncbi:NAD(P)-binding protein [Xylariaceae sp. FL0255]|nr:NAD(P)-binding protein [Xylariaceae sp. FL0255]
MGIWKDSLLPVLLGIYALYAEHPSPGWAISLHVLLGLSIAIVLNRALNLWAMNNWSIRAHTGWDWDSEVAVVTGGSGDIGQGLVEGLLAKGGRVAILDMRPPPETKPSGKNDMNDTEKKSKNLIFIKCDVSNPADIAVADETIHATFGAHPSILINNAGMIRTGTPILCAKEADLRAAAGVNFLAHWLTTQQFLPHMLAKNKGHIVTISSLAAYIALPASVDYAATKAASLAFHEGLTCEIKHIYKSPGVMTSIVHSAFVKTQMTATIWDEVEAAGVKLLTVDQVTEPVLKQIFERRGGQVFVPETHAVVSLLRSFPNWLQEIVRDQFGKAKRAPIGSPYVKQ